MKLKDLIRQDRFASPAQEAVLNVVATSSWATRHIASALSPFGVTPAQYNVLRILRGIHPGRHTCTEVGERLVDRMPDVTRLLDRLEREGLVVRKRSDNDRRVVEVGITDAGLAMLDRIDGPAEGALNEVAGALSPRELELLTELLEKMRSHED